MEKVSQMVEVHFFLIVFLVLLSFSMGRSFGRVESSLQYHNRMQQIIDAIRKVEKLALLKGEDISNLPTSEIVERAQKQISIKTDNE